MSDFLTRISQYSPKRLALLADDLRQKVAELENRQNEAIAIVGIGCRFPGGVRTLGQFWELMMTGVSAIREVPQDRWDIDAFYHPDPDAPGKASTRWGGFIDEVDQFDPAFFGISPREAQSMDPQQRVLMEVTWEALEHAGISPHSLEGTLTAVYFGLSSADYYQLVRAAGTAAFDAYTASGFAHSVASGRVSYFLGLKGPSVSIDTACSSSLAAIHHAVTSLRLRESNMALAGGVNLVLRPDLSIALSKAHMMAPDGLCKAFDARADGFVRGEGCGVVVLKRLSDAQEAGDRIIAVIRGSASNQDGRSNGLTAPNGPSQEAVIREALTNASTAPAAVAFVEAHGTGTSLGDPIEVQALGAVFGSDRSTLAPLLVGSVKANIGHLEAAAGVAGLIKLALALKHGEIPAQIHLSQPNPHIAWKDVGVHASTTGTPWPTSDGHRRVGGVSSFGFSGTNVHMVLEEAPLPLQELPSLPERPAHVVTVSARTDTALKALAAAYARLLRGGDVSLADFAFTTNAGRAHFAHRAACVPADAGELADTLEMLADGRPAGFAGVSGARRPAVGFLLGDALARPAETRVLFDTLPPFRDALTRSAAVLQPHLSEPLLDAMFVTADRINVDYASDVVQAGIFALEYSLATVLMSWGVRPVVISGQRAGALAAACLAEAITLDDVAAIFGAGCRLKRALGSPNEQAAHVEFGGVIRGIRFRTPAIELTTAVTDTPPGSEFVTADFWLRALVTPAEPRIGVPLPSFGDRIVVDLRPGGTALDSNRSNSAHTATWLSPLRTGLGLWRGLLETLAMLYVSGVDIDWRAFDAPYRRQTLDLPGYPFQRQRHWIELPSQPAPTEQPLLHPLLGYEVRQSLSPSRLFSSYLDVARLGQLRVPQVSGSMIVPSSVFMEMAFAAAREQFHSSVVHVDDFTLHQALTLTAAATTQVVLAPPVNSTCELRITSQTAADLPWVVHATARVSCSDGQGDVRALDTIRARMTESVEVGDYYDWLATLGLTVGPALRAIQSIRRRDGEVLARMLASPDVEADSTNYIQHPARLDACLHIIAAALKSAGHGLTDSFLLLNVERIAVYGSVRGTFWVHAALDAPPGLAQERSDTLRAHVALIDDNGTVLVDLHGVLLKRARQGIQNLAERFPPRVRSMWYQTVWRDADALPLQATDTGKDSRFVVVADQHEVGDAIADALRNCGAVVDLLRTSHPDLIRAEMEESLRAPCDGVVFLPALDNVAKDGVSAERILSDQQSLMSAALATIQPLTTLHGRLPRLWLLTRGVQPTGNGDSANPAQATLWGLSHVVALEHPNLRCTRIDLDPKTTAVSDVELVTRELLHPGREDQICLRGGRRLVRRLVRLPDPTADDVAMPRALAPDRTYLVVGGLRGLGLRVAEWLAEQGARHVAVMARSVPDERATRTFDRLRARGIHVLELRGDVGVRQDVEQALERIRATKAPLSGIVHAASVVDDGVLTAQTWPHFARVMQPKVVGAWLLHELAGPLDFMVLFSSGASVAGSAGQASWAAANAFEDALAWYRQSQGLPTVSVNWGPWAESEATAERRFVATGLSAIAPVDGLASLDYALRSHSDQPRLQTTQMAVFAADWLHLVDSRAAQSIPPLFDELVAEAARQRPVDVARAAAPPVPSLRNRLRDTAANRRRAVLRSFVREQTVKILGLKQLEDLDINEPLRQVGLDSLMAVELRNVIGTAAGQTLPATVTFDYPSVVDLAEFLATEVLAEEMGNVAASNHAPASASQVPEFKNGALDTMTEDELAVRLAARLAEIGNLEKP